MNNFDQVLFDIGCRDGRPIVDSGSVMSTCPVNYAMSVTAEKVHHNMKLESVLRESLQHYVIKRNVPFTNRTGSTMNVSLRSLTQNVQFCLCIRAAAAAR